MFKKNACAFLIILYDLHCRHTIIECVIYRTTLHICEKYVLIKNYIYTIPLKHIPKNGFMTPTLSHQGKILLP